MFGYNLTRSPGAWWLYSKHMKVQLRINRAKNTYVFVQLGKLRVTWN
jgi:hypothetical protein